MASKRRNKNKKQETTEIEHDSLVPKATDDFRRSKSAVPVDSLHSIGEHLWSVQWGNLKSSERQPPTPSTRDSSPDEGVVPADDFHHRTTPKSPSSNPPQLVRAPLQEPTRISFDSKSKFINKIYPSIAGFQIFLKIPQSIISKCDRLNKTNGMNDVMEVIHGSTGATPQASHGANVFLGNHGMGNGFPEY
ncbi:hypothetical protein AAG570_005057 [Ranatra chinensis]|uniref:Uncharacterized protein n=1 Tax=Ranatra chinensis TaxID=642074 RepID=A0ABD0YMY7_9HEMI